MKPFLLLATRTDETIADDEYESFQRSTGLSERALLRLRLEREALPVLDLDDYSGVILGGSPFTTTDPVEGKSAVQLRVERELLAFLDRIVAVDHPFFGACYGVGTLGTHQGAVVDRRYGEPIGAVRVELSEEGRKDPLCDGLPDSFDAYVGHKEAVSELPAHAVRLAGSASCPVQMFRVRRNLYATQFHPELDYAGLALRVDAYSDNGYFPPGDAVVVKERAAATPVTEPGRLLRNFAERYAR